MINKKTKFKEAYHAEEECFVRKESSVIFHIKKA